MNVISSFAKMVDQFSLIFHFTLHSANLSKRAVSNLKKKNLIKKWN